MALFGDMRDPKQFTVEFFNSSGQSPCYEYSSWLIETSQSLNKIAPTKMYKVCAIQQQYSKTECGVYSLYYIWARLNNAFGPEFLLKNKIDDKKMFEFRQHLFWDKTSVLDVGDRFDYSKFEASYQPKWER
jgi:hypothetical protein